MPEVNPYLSPSTSSELTAERGEPRLRIWRAYLIAPLAAPIAAAAVSFFAALFFYDPTSTGTPVGIILLPMMLLTFGGVVSYVLALVVGMPVVLLLRGQRRLNGYTIHLAAILVCLLFSLVWAVVAQAAENSLTSLEVFQGFAIVFLVMTPFVLISTCVFWLVARRT